MKDEPSCSRRAPTDARPAETPPSAPPSDDVVWKATVRPSDPVRGPADALVTGVLFSDFECPFCKQAAAVWATLLERYPRELRLVWKDLPLPQHQHADFAAHFGRAVFAQAGSDAFWKAHDLLFEHQPDFDNDRLYSIAHRIGGLKWEPIRAAVRLERHAPELYESLKLADRLEVRKTPTVFLNGHKAEGAQSVEALAEIVDVELAKARALVKTGTPRTRIYASIVSEGHEVEPLSDLEIE